MKIQLEYERYKQFRLERAYGEPSYLRYGQAFYHYFQLHKMSNQEQFDGLYNAPDAEALSLIEEMFEFV